MRAQIRSPERLSQLLMALTVALSWLTLLRLPEVRAMTPRLAGGRSPKREGERRKLGVGTAGEARRPTAIMPAPTLARRVGGYASADQHFLTQYSLREIKHANTNM